LKDVKCWRWMCCFELYDTTLEVEDHFDWYIVVVIFLGNIWGFLWNCVLKLFYWTLQNHIQFVYGVLQCSRNSSIQDTLIFFITSVLWLSGFIDASIPHERREHIYVFNLSTTTSWFLVWKIKKINMFHFYL
jgi:hypothetical protein